MSDERADELLQGCGLDEWVDTFSELLLTNLSSC